MDGKIPLTNRSCFDPKIDVKTLVIILLSKTESLCELVKGRMNTCNKIDEHNIYEQTQINFYLLRTNLIDLQLYHF